MAADCRWKPPRSGSAGALSKLYRLENGRSRITTDDLADMLDLYGSAPRSARR